MKIRKWLATDEVKKHFDLEQWAKDELAKDELAKDEFFEDLAKNGESLDELEAELRLAIEERIKEIRAKEQRRPRRPGEYSLDNWPQWVLKPLEWLFARIERDLSSQ